MSGSEASRKNLPEIALLLLVLFLPFPGYTAHASTILSVSGPKSGGFYDISKNQVAAASWSIGLTFDDVDISVLLGDGPARGTAYLTTAIGPQTTADQEIARTNFTFPPFIRMVTLFEHVTLFPGTYYLVFASNDPSGHIGGVRDAYDCGTICQYPTPVVVTASGVTRNPDYLSRSVNPYAPASLFSQNVGINGDLFLSYALTAKSASISGSDGASVPEPGTFGLFLAGALAALFVCGTIRIARSVQMEKRL